MSVNDYCTKKAAPKGAALRAGERAMVGAIAATIAIPNAF